MRGTDTAALRRDGAAPHWISLALVGAALLASCRPAGPPPAPSTRPPAEEPIVRIGIAVDTERVEVSAPTPFEIALPSSGETVNSAAGERWTFTADVEGRVQGKGPAGRGIGPVSGVLRIQPKGGKGTVTIAGQPYRGGALIRAAGKGRVTAINTVLLEEYLFGVVPLEIGVRPPEEAEAVKAQAVAARTYAVGHLGSRQTLGFDFFATVADQVYGGVAKEDPTTTRAVRDTRGEIVTYNDLPIMAYYHSTCGGRTAAIEEVWERPPLPYLKSVSDEVEGQKGRYYDESSSRFRWEENWSGAELKSILARTLRPQLGAAKIQRLEKVEVAGRTPSGRARALQITVDGKSYEVRGDSIRWALQTKAGQPLNSTLFVLDVEREKGEVRSVRARGGGWGHGIGLCQVGAMGRARAGQNYRRILTSYYQGTKVTRVY